MNKKFLSAILFGAMLATSAGTFVSCKDYDDDIENLQSQINNLATKSDVEAKLSQLQVALDAAKAESSANAAKIAAIKQCQCDVDAMMKKIQDAVDADMKKYADEINALIEQAEAIVGEIADYVTSVELVDSYTAANGNWAKANERGHVVVSTTIEKENVFSKDIANAITFVKGTEIQTPNSFLVRVSPTNAVLTKDMISLVNSKGESLADVMEVVKVEKADVLLSRGATNNGLWNISVQAKNYGDGKAFAAATLVDTKKAADAAGNRVLFAAQVNNSLASAEARYVSSTYDLSFGWEPFVSAATLNFTVDGTDVAEINNRFANTSKSLKEQGKATMYAELEWAASTEKYPTPAVAIDKDKKNVQPAADNRSDKAVALAVQGKAVKIALFETNEEGEKVAPKNVRAIYVTLDKANAVESAPSELNAWNSYSYTGLNTVVEGTSTEITINGDQTINDYIGFRVYAVNFDGTLVDPDGKAFYVLVGAPADEWQIAATTIVPDADAATTPREEKSKAVAVTTSKLTAPYSWSWKVDEKNVPFSIALADKDGKVLKANATQNAIFDHNTTWEGTNIGADFKFENIKTIYTIPAADKAWTDYEDNKAYTGTFTVKNEAGFVLATIRVSMTKELPTTLPEGFSFKDKQIINGIYNCYLEATDWAAGDATLSDGKMKVENFINFGKGNAAQFDLTFAESALDKDDKKVNVTAKGNGYINVTNAFIDNATEHASKVVYNYGQISSVKVDGKFVDYTITAAEFKTVWCCFYKSDVHTWGWITREQLGAEYTAKGEDGNYTKALPYDTALTYASNEESHIAYVFGKNAIDGEFSKTLDQVYNGSLVVKEAKLISDATEKEDYFSVSNDLAFTAIKTDLGSNPKADVPSTLIITCEDYYGHKITIKLPMTVKPRI